MDILYSFDVHLKIGAKQSGSASAIVEARTKLEAIGPIFKAWYRKDGLPTTQGNNAVAEACVAGLVLSVHTIASESGTPVSDILEFFIARTRAMADTIESTGTVKEATPAPPPVTHSPN